MEWCLMELSLSLSFSADVNLFCSIWSVLWRKSTKALCTFQEKQLDPWYLFNRLVSPQSGLGFFVVFVIFMWKDSHGIIYSFCFVFLKLYNCCACCNVGLSLVQLWLHIKITPLPQYSVSKHDSEKTRQTYMWAFMNICRLCVCELHPLHVEITSLVS